jgi:hypothetical protein
MFCKQLCTRQRDDDVTFSCLRRGWGVSGSAAGAASCFRLAGSAAAGAASASVRSAACSGFTAAASLAAILLLPASAALRPLSRAYMDHTICQRNPHTQQRSATQVNMHIGFTAAARSHRNAAPCVCVKRWCFLLPFRRHHGCFGIWRVARSSRTQAGGAERCGFPTVALAARLCCGSLQHDIKLHGTTCTTHTSTSRRTQDSTKMACDPRSQLLVS